MAEEAKQRAIAGEDDDDDDDDDEEEKESETETEGEELEGDEWEAVSKAKGEGDLIPQRERERERGSSAAAAAAPANSNSSKAKDAKVEVVEAASSTQLGERRAAAAAAAGARHLFQRLWTDEEEIRILRGFLEFTRRRGTTFASHQYDTGPFYEEIRQQLHLDFSKNQLVEKLRRLKKKYRNCAARMRSKGPAFSFRSPHEHQIFDIARHIWRPANKRLMPPLDPDPIDPDDFSFSFSFSSSPLPHAHAHALQEPDPAAKPTAPSSSAGRRRARRRLNRHPPPPPPQPAVPVTAAIPVSISPPIHHHEAAAAAAAPLPVPPPLISSSTSPAAVQDVLHSCLSPLFKELIGSAAGPSSLGLFSLGPVPACPPGKTADEKWRKQQILELEVYLQRIELVKEQVMQALQDLKSSTS